MTATFAWAGLDRKVGDVEKRAVELAVIFLSVESNAQAKFTMQLFRSIAAGSALNKRAAQKLQEPLDASWDV